METFACVLLVYCLRNAGTGIHVIISAHDLMPIQAVSQCDKGNQVSTKGTVRMKETHKWSEVNKSIPEGVIALKQTTIGIRDND